MLSFGIFNIPVFYFVKFSTFERRIQFKRKTSTCHGFFASQLEELTSFKSIFETRNNGKLIYINLNDIRSSNLKS